MSLDRETHPKTGRSIKTGSWAVPAPLRHTMGAVGGITHWVAELNRLTKLDVSMWGRGQEIDGHKMRVT